MFALKKPTLKIIISLSLIVFLIFALAIPAFAECTILFYDVPNFNYIAYGYNNSYVKVLQRFFTCYTSTSRNTLIDGGGITGYFGNTTQNLVLSFQEAQGLSADGKVGTNTWNAICGYIYDMPSSASINEGDIRSNVYADFSHLNIMKYKYINEGYYHYYACDINGNRDGTCFRTVAVY